MADAYGRVFGLFVINSSHIVLTNADLINPDHESQEYPIFLNKW